MTEVSRTNPPSKHCRCGELKEFADDPMCEWCEMLAKESCE